MKSRRLRSGMLAGVTAAALIIGMVGTPLEVANAAFSEPSKYRKFLKNSKHTLSRVRGKRTFGKPLSSSLAGRERYTPMEASTWVRKVQEGTALPTAWAKVGGRIEIHELKIAEGKVYTRNNWRQDTGWRWDLGQQGEGLDRTGKWGPLWETLDGTPNGTPDPGRPKMVRNLQGETRPIYEHLNAHSMVYVPRVTPGNDIPPENLPPVDKPGDKAAKNGGSAPGSWQKLTAGVNRAVGKRMAERVFRKWTVATLDSRGFWPMRAQAWKKELESFAGDPKLSGTHVKLSGAYVSVPSKESSSGRRIEVQHLRMNGSGKVEIAVTYRQEINVDPSRGLVADPSRGLKADPSRGLKADPSRGLKGSPQWENPTTGLLPKLEEVSSPTWLPVPERGLLTDGDAWVIAGAVQEVDATGGGKIPLPAARLVQAPPAQAGSPPVRTPPTESASVASQPVADQPVASQPVAGQP